MRRKFTCLLVVSSFAPGLSVFAQIEVQPNLVLDGPTPPPARNCINSADIADSRVDGEPRLRFDWTASFTGNQNFEFEVTYDRLSTQSIPATRVLLENEAAGDEFGSDVRNGVRQSIWMRPHELAHDPISSSGVIQRDFDDGARSIILRVGPSTFDEDQTASNSWEVRIDTIAPEPPILTSVEGGENRLEVNWTAPTERVDDVHAYEVVWCANAGTSTLSQGMQGELTELPCEESEQRTKQVGDEQTSASVEGGLTKGVPAAVAVRSVDLCENKGAIGRVMLATPLDVIDFYELYQRAGGQEDAGFCFIATAAYGSYAHPTVRVFRAFRDRVLMPTPLGRMLVGLYYAYSPPFAARVKHDAGLAAWTRLGLIPVAAGALLVLGFPLVALLTLFFGLFGRAKSWRRLVPSLLVLGVMGLPGASEAAPRPKSKHGIGLGFELKGGPYGPELQKERLGEVRPFEAVFQDTGPNPLYTLALDFQLVRSFGTFGVGGSFGFMQFVGRSLVPDQTNPEKNTDLARSRDTTVFNILPLNFVAFYRFDWLVDHTPVPFVPYVRGGLAYHIWWATTGTGKFSRVDGTKARGGKWGWTGTVGLSFYLNAIEPRAAANLFEATGIRGTYIFGEYQTSKVDDFGGQGFDLSDSTWNIGLYLEM